MLGYGMFFKIYRIFSIFLLFGMLLKGEVVEIKQLPLSLLERSQLYVDAEDLPLASIVNQKLFKPYDKSSIIIGEDRSAIWVKLELKNSIEKEIAPLLVVKDPTLEHIVLYEGDGYSEIWRGGTADFKREHHTLYPAKEIRFKPFEQKTLYLKVYGEYLPVGFTLYLKEKERYFKEQQYEQLLDIFLLGIIFAFMLYSFVHASYLREASYFFYGLYLLALLYSLFNYLGILQLYAPPWFVKFDAEISMTRVYLVLVANILFALVFLEIRRYAKIYAIYLLLIILATLGAIFGNAPSSLALQLLLGLALVVIFYNFGVALYLYFIKKERVVRFYLMGFGIVFFSYVLMISDSLGYSYISQHYYNLILWSTMIEALILYLAFADRYSMVEKERYNMQYLLLAEAKKRAEIIEEEVNRKTHELNEALSLQKILLSEVHHRVKNNLQIILSIITMQSNKFKDSERKEAFVDLENRINAMAQSYELLIVEEQLSAIDMREYLSKLVKEIADSFFVSDKKIEMRIDIEAVVPLKEAIYIGLIVNELITNSYKYLIKNGGGKIYLILKEEEGGLYALTIRDTGKGFSPDSVERSLGLTLIYALVEEQLKGSITFKKEPSSTYIIHFKL